MPRGGQNKRPVALHKRAGTYREDRHRDRTPHPTPIAPKPPRWLSKPARTEWRRLAPQLDRLGLLTAVDGPAFALLCDTLARLQEYRAQIDREGAVIDGYRGAARKHPLLGPLAQLQRQATTLMEQFGLSPASRARLELPPPDDGTNGGWGDLLD